MLDNKERKQSDRYCEFHIDNGHNTNDCYHLKRRIEEAVRSGQLAHLVKDIKTRTPQIGRHPKKGKEDKEQNNKIRNVKMIRAESSHWKRKEPESHSWMNQEISFPPRNECCSTQQPIVVEGRMGNAVVPRIYVDTDSSTEVIYEHFFHRLKPHVQARLRSPYSPLQGFSGEMS